MAVRKHLGERLRRHHKRRRDYTPAEAAELLAPLEERTATPHHNGAIIVDTDEMKLPRSLMGEEEDGGSLLRLDPVVATLLVLALLFIAAIAYLISVEPRKSDYMPVKIVKE